MRVVGWTAAIVAVLCAAVRMVSAQDRSPSLIDVGGHKLNVQIAGTAKPGIPTIVFEAGLGSPLLAWNSINLTTADSARTIAYERDGIGKSDPGTEPPTLKHMIADLHALLSKVGAAPPYVLVGHSLGGPIINAYAATYPKDVAGLVFIDPTDFTQTTADMTAIWDKLGVKNGLDSSQALQERMLVGASPAIVAESREFERVERGGFAEFRAAGEAPDVPMVVLLAGKTDPLPPSISFPGNYQQFMRITREQRIEHFGRLAGRASQGTLVLTSKSSHFIQMSEPELAVWAIRRVMALTSPHPELQRFVGEYPLVPGFTIAITRDGGKLFLQATGQQAFPLEPESPTSFSIKLVGAVIEFETDATGNVTALVLVQNGGRQRAPKAK